MTTTNDIPGVTELRQASRAIDNVQHDFTSAWERGDGVCPSPRPKGPSLHQLRQQYPRAAAYLLAEAHALCSHDAKVAGGRRAMARIEAGEDHETAIADMRAEWQAAAERHATD